jgi:hypothetical protein
LGWLLRRHDKKMRQPHVSEQDRSPISGDGLSIYPTSRLVDMAQLVRVCVGMYNPEK